MHKETASQTPVKVRLTDNSLQTLPKKSTAWRIGSNLLQLFGLAFILTLCSNLFLTQSSTSVAKRTPTLQKCTAIKVPISTNFPIEVAGQQFKSPQEYSAAFKPILSVVELPKGYKAVGGGAGFVIACTE